MLRPPAACPAMGGLRPGARIARRAVVTGFAGAGVYCLPEAGGTPPAATAGPVPGGRSWAVKLTVVGRIGLAPAGQAVLPGHVPRVGVGRALPGRSSQVSNKVVQKSVYRRFNTSAPGHKTPGPTEPSPDAHPPRRRDSPRAELRRLPPWRRGSAPSVGVVRSGGGLGHGCPGHPGPEPRGDPGGTLCHAGKLCRLGACDGLFSPPPPLPIPVTYSGAPPPNPRSSNAGGANYCVAQADTLSPSGV